MCLHQRFYLLNCFLRVSPYFWFHNRWFLTISLLCALTVFTSLRVKAADSIDVVTSATMSNHVPFSVTISVLDQTGSPISNYTGSVNFSISRGTCTPLSVSNFNFSSGSRTVQVTTTAAAYDTVLTATENGSSVSGSAPVPVDTDGDGMTDNYELNHFGDITDFALPDVDDDFDGWSNLEEFIMVSIPTDPDSFFVAPIFKVVETDVVLTFVNTSSARLYTPEFNEIGGTDEWIPLAPAERGTDGDLVFTDVITDPPRVYRGNVSLP